MPNALKLPTDLYMGEAAGVAVNSKGHIFVFHRGGSSHGPAFANTAAQLWEFDSDGRFLREIGKNLYAWSFAHAVRIDKDDNIWVIDKGSDMIVRFNPEGRVTMVIGRKPEASDADAKPYEHVNPPLPPQNGRFRQPTDVTWDPAGDIFISDGYINSRVAKLNKDGDWVASFGTPGKGEGQFNTVHNIASDVKGTIYVADRGNRRIQVLDADGKVQRIITIDIPPDPDAQPAIGNKPDLTDYLQKGGTRRPAHHGRCASRRRRTRCSTSPTPSPGASTSLASTARCWACSAARESSSSSSAGSMPSPARTRTRSTSPKSSIGECRS